MAANAMLTSPEETIRLRLELKKDPDYASSPSWPSLVEWCSTCTSTRLVKLVLPEEEQVNEEEETKVEEKTKVDGNVEMDEASCCEATCRDACTQTPRRRRRGGRGSKMRRLLEFQLLLTKKKGLPLSRLLTKMKETVPRDSRREEQMRLQEESASPLLKSKKVNEDVKEEESGPGMGAPSSGSNDFTLRSSPTVANPPSNQPLPHGPCLPSSTAFPLFTPPLFTPTPLTPPWIPFQHPPQFGQMPAANWVVCGSCQTWGTVAPLWAAQ